MIRSYVFFALALSLVPCISSCILNPEPDECLEVSGTVTEVYEGGDMDAFFKIEGDHRTFYINRGLENGLNLDSLQKLVYQSVTMMYVDIWTPLDPNGNIRHVSQLMHGDKLLYSEFSENSTTGN